MTVETNPNYWDCECENNYIHAKAHVVCPSCKSFDYYILKENENE
jgi:Zn finger protein HypA/HybF involved in hydrogenase expression